MMRALAAAILLLATAWPASAQDGTLSVAISMKEAVAEIGRSSTAAPR